MKACQHCGFEFRLNIISDRCSGAKYLRSGWCDAPLRECPDPDKLLQSPCLSQQEQDYLKKLVDLPWFSGQIAAILLQIESKALGVTAIGVRLDVASCGGAS